MICEQESEKLRLNVWNIRIDGVDVRVECLKCCSWSDKGNFNIDFSCCSIFNGVLRRLLWRGFGEWCCQFVYLMCFGTEYKTLFLLGSEEKWGRDMVGSSLLVLRRHHYSTNYSKLFKNDLIVDFAFFN